MQGGLATVTQLLASSNLSDVTEAISLLICYDKFCIKGSKETLRQMLPLIFTREQGVSSLLSHHTLWLPSRQPAIGMTSIVCIEVWT